MSWEAITSIANTISACAVVVSLIYVAIQVRQNTNTVRAAAHQATNDGILELNQIAFASDESAELWRKGRFEYEQLNPTQAGRFRGFVINCLLVCESTYFQYNHGLLSVEYFERNERWLAWLFTQPGFLQCWPDVQFIFSDSFVDYASALIPRSKPDS